MIGTAISRARSQAAMTRFLQEQEALRHLPGGTRVEAETWLERVRQGLWELEINATGPVLSGPDCVLCAAIQTAVERFLPPRS